MRERVTIWEVLRSLFSKQCFFVDNDVEITNFAGVITAKNTKIFCETFDYDNLIYYEDSSCSTCGILT